MLQSALDDHRIIVYYQSVIDLFMGSVVGFEALARIAEHDGSILVFSVFIPGAEDSGLVVLFDAHVLGMACQEARGWQPVGLTVAVNLSACQFESGCLLAVLGKALEQTGLDPERLHLELIETAIIELRSDILQQLAHIRDFGVQIGFDDFGTGPLVRVNVMVDLEHDLYVYTVSILPDVRQRTLNVHVHPERTILRTARPQTKTIMSSIGALSTKTNEEGAKVRTVETASTAVTKQRSNMARFYARQELASNPKPLPS
jgi:predicted signal transduction protein with EAL and GGDEF domain